MEYMFTFPQLEHVVPPVGTPCSPIWNTLKFNPMTFFPLGHPDGEPLAEPLGR